MHVTIIFLIYLVIDLIERLDVHIIIIWGNCLSSRSSSQMTTMTRPPNPPKLTPFDHRSRHRRLDASIRHAFATTTVVRYN